MSGGGQKPEAGVQPVNPADLRIILASRSPRRFELLSLIVPRERIRVLPPSSADEAGFEGLTTRTVIERRLRSVAAAKCDDVLRQLGDEAGWSLTIAADTVIVAGEHDGELVVLGQPPESEWRETTRRWFFDYYAGRSHVALTGLCVATPTGRREFVVETRVTFRADAAKYLDWYLDTEESRGKAGGYAIQGAGSVFVDRLDGSLTNVVGLPLRELLTVLRELGTETLNFCRN